MNSRQSSRRPPHTSHDHQQPANITRNKDRHTQILHAANVSTSHYTVNNTSSTICHQTWKLAHGSLGSHHDRRQRRQPNSSASGYEIVRGRMAAQHPQSESVHAMRDRVHHVNWVPGMENQQTQRPSQQRGRSPPRTIPGAFAILAPSVSQTSSFRHGGTPAPIGHQLPIVEPPAQPPSCSWATSGTGLQPDNVTSIDTGGSKPGCENTTTTHSPRTQSATTTKQQRPEMASGGLPTHPASIISSSTIGSHHNQQLQQLSDPSGSRETTDKSNRTTSTKSAPWSDTTSTTFTRRTTWYVAKQWRPEGTGGN